MLVTKTNTYNHYIAEQSGKLDEVRANLTVERTKVRMLSEKLAEATKVFKEKIESSVKEISKLKEQRLVENERLESLIISQPFYR